MKATIIKLLFFFSIIALSSCESDLRMPDCAKTAFPLLTIDPSADKEISQSGVLNAKFSVDMYYKDYPQNARIVVAYKGDYTNVKVFKDAVTTFPSTQTLTGDQLKQLFGLASIVPGDYFEIGLDVQMADGNWYPAFNPAGVAYGSGPMNLKGASPVITYKCPLPVDKFVGSYLCDEPAEAYNYGVSFTRKTTSSIQTANYWNSGWTAVFSLDFVNNTYSMPLTTFTSGYSAVESGTIDQTTGKLVGNYTIYHNGAVEETGVHTYTRK